MKRSPGHVVVVVALLQAACASIPVKTQDRLDQLQDAQGESYQLVRNIRASEAKNPPKRCECVRRAAASKVLNGTCVHRKAASGNVAPGDMARS